MRHPARARQLTAIKASGTTQGNAGNGKVVPLPRRPRLLQPVMGGNSRKPSGTRQAASTQRFWLGKQWLRLLLENAEDMIAMLNPEGRCLYFAASPRYKIPPEKVMGRLITEVYAPEFAEPLRQQINEVIRTGQPSTVELPMEWEGELLWFSNLVSPVRDGRGELMGTVTVARNITESRRVEAALRESEQRLRAMFENAADAIYVKNTRGEYVLANRVLTDFLGVEPEVLIGRRLSDLCQSPTVSAVEETDRQVLAGETVKGVIHGEHRGQSYALQFSKVPLRDEQGNITGLFAITRDITEQVQQREMLEKSRDHYLRLWDKIPALLWRSGTDGLCDHFNRAWLDFTGRSMAEETGNGWAENVHPKDLDHCLAVYLEAFAARQPFEMEYRLKRQDGKYRWIRDFGTPYSDLEGNFAGYIGTCFDITEQRQSRQELQAERDKLMAILNAMSDGVYISDPEYRIVYANPALERHFGPGRGWHCFEYLHQRNRPCPWCKSAPVFSGESVAWEWHHTSAGRYYEVFDTPILSEEGGLLKLQILHDITARKEVEDELRASEERLKQAQVLGKLGSWDFDLKTNRAHWSDQTYSMYERDPALGTPSFEEVLAFHQPEDQAWILQATDRAMNSGESSERDVCIRLPSGRIVWQHAVIQPVMDEQGVVTKLTGTVQDITERKQAEAEKEKLAVQLRQTQKLDTIGTLAGGIAHDFNNILTPIMAYTEMAVRSMQGQNDVREDLEHVIEAAHRARDLIRQILTFSRQNEQERLPVRLGPVVKEALKLLRASLPATVDIYEHIRPDCGTVLANPSQIHQVLLNLCTNAFHAMKDGEGTLTVTMEPVVLAPGEPLPHPALPAGGYVCLTVADTGCGMDAQTLERIYEPFFTTKKVGEGTGLGLPVVHGIVTGHGGAITVESTVGAGTTFHVYLPQEQAAEQPIADADLPTGGGREAILFVDDDVEVARVMRRALERLGYQVVTRNNPLEALELFRQNPYRFDVLVTDQTMPLMTGDKLAAHVLDVRADMPIVLMTGYGHIFTEAKARKAGIRRLVFKPIVGEELGRAVRCAVDSAGVESVD